MIVNFYADPYAVREVLGLDTSSSAPHFPLDRFVLCPLDLTTKHGLSMGTYAERIDPLFKNSTTPSEEGSKPAIHHFTSSVLERTKDVLEQLGIYDLHLHDPLAVWCAIENPPVKEEKGDGMPVMQKGWECTPRMFDIERSGPNETR
jgi:inosine-uridine nucleoside N-ribohydrolase